MSPAARVLVAVIGLYRRLLSPMLGRHCRFEPTCSAYAMEAIRTHGAARGGVLALRRIARCHPWSPGGLDPVPAPEAAPEATPGRAPTPEGRA